MNSVPGEVHDEGTGGSLTGSESNSRRQAMTFRTLGIGFLASTHLLACGEEAGLRQLPPSPVDPPFLIDFVPNPGEEEHEHGDPEQPVEPAEPIETAEERELLAVFSFEEPGLASGENKEGDTDDWKVFERWTVSAGLARPSTQDVDRVEPLPDPADGHQSGMVYFPGARYGYAKLTSREVVPSVRTGDVYEVAVAVALATGGDPDAIHALAGFSTPNGVPLHLPLVGRLQPGRFIEFTTRLTVTEDMEGAALSVQLLANGTQPKPTTVFFDHVRVYRVRSGPAESAPEPRVVNASFEVPLLGAEHFTYFVPWGWSASGATPVYVGTHHSSTVQIPRPGETLPEPAHGFNALEVNPPSGTDRVRIASVPWMIGTANRRYRLTVAVGRRADQAAPQGAAVSILAGSHEVANAVTTPSSFVPGSFIDLSTCFVAEPVDDGVPLQVVLETWGGGNLHRVYFDTVRLEEVESCR